ncbi:redox-regulated ATPase YchF [Patescibacteria group bacterium AH-259-L05]|nr:redox-regulated ATPase YchF [Patescibacteria group bacterium AH-259-L05]
MSFSIGIIGLPNVGKSTLFKALTKKSVDISNYPFCTIDPNIGNVKIPDRRLDKLADVLNPKQVLPTYVEFVDIAGLVKGAHKGEGLGNQFLSHIREVDALVEIIRSFSDPDVSHVSGKIDPHSDKETIKLELIFADLKTIEKNLEKTSKYAKIGDKKATKIIIILEKLKSGLDHAKPVSKIELVSEEKSLLSYLNLLTAKPIIYVINIDENVLSNQQPTTSNQIFLCAKLEAELVDLSSQEAKEYLQEYNIKTSALDTLITAAYNILNLITFITFQNQILQAWTIPSGSTALNAAEKIHTDMAQGFIKAEIINWQDLVKYKSEQKAREAGLMRTEGKEYIIHDGDVIHFKFKA